MNTSAPRIWVVWLWLATIGLMVFGLSMVLLPDLIRWAFSWMLYADGGHVTNQFGVPANDYIRLLHGVLGSVMFGWGVMIAMVLRGPLARGDAGALNLTLLPLLAWFVPDTLFSLYTGFWQNAVLNTVFLLMFVVPLMALKSHQAKT